MRTLLILLFIPMSAMAQSVSVSSPSFALWGSSEGLAQLSVEYKNIELHYFHYMQEPHPLASNHHLSTMGISYKPISIKNILNLGVLLTHKPFPTMKSVRTNFIVDVGINIDRFRIYYMHISNGFGLQGNSYNDGYDSITMRVRLF